MEWRRRLSAWTVSVAVHAALLGIAVLSLQRSLPGPRVAPEPLVYVEPAPPPPPPPPAAPAPARAEPTPPPDPAPVERRLVEPKPRARPKHPGPPRPAPTPAAPAEPAGTVGGVPGGVAGGQAGSSGDAPVPAELVATPPVVVARVAPAYPAAARARGLQALVVLRAVIDRDGRVEPDVAVIESVALFDEAAIAAIRQWRFTPGRDRDGRPVRVVLEVPVRFRLR